MADVFDRLKAALSDRYTIERELGAGGMATVYLAHDIRHERQVAVKVLRPDLAAALGPDRFLQEIRIAANLHHPHILPLYDSGESDGFLYYVMPYEQGQSLRERLAREGELPVTEAVRILREVVDALVHAHEHGVVHRDIKPDNVMLSGRHALVTDFGVAKAVSEATGRQQLTTEGVALGTPAYMAPEQASADPHIDHRADIYAVGAVAYELLTGRPPFTGTTQQEILAAHVTQAADPVTKYRASVPPALAELVMKCLEKKAADRWQTAEELLPQLEALATPSGGVTPTGMTPVDRRVKRRWMMAGGVLGVAAVIAVFVVMAALLRGSGMALDERRVAVLPFENQTGEDSLDVHGQVAASWITDWLQQVDVLSVVPSAVVQQEVRAVEEGNLVRELAEVTGAGTVVMGRYSRLGDSLRFRAEITDPRRMELQHTVPPVNVLSTSPEAALNELGERIAGALAVMLDTVFGGEFSRSLRQPSFTAYREYATGHDLFISSRFDEAIEHFRRAYEIDTTFVIAQFRAAFAHLNRGRLAEVDSVLQMVEQRRDRLSSYDLGLLTWLRPTLEGNILETWQVSCRLAEENLNTWYNCGTSAALANRPQEAIEALERIDPTKGSMKEWVPYWEYLTLARHMLGDHRRELRDARRGREQHPDRLEAFRYEARALAALGRVDEIRLLLDELVSLAPDPSWGHAESAAIAGLEFRAHDHPEAAREVLQLALDRLRTYLPGEDQRRNYQRNVGRTLYWSEQWEEAREIFSQLAAEDTNSVNCFGHLGVVQARLGNTEEASRISVELAALDRPYLYGANTEWQARIAAVLGNREQAVELLRRAFNEGLMHGVWLHRYPEFESLRDYPPFQELMRPKG